MGKFLPMQSDIFTNIWKSCVFRTGIQLVICDVYVYLHASWLTVGLAPWYPFKHIHTVMCWNSEKKILYTTRLSVKLSASIFAAYHVIHYW